MHLVLPCNCLHSSTRRQRIPGFKQLNESCDAGKLLGCSGTAPVYAVARQLQKRNTARPQKVGQEAAAAIRLPAAPLVKLDYPVYSILLDQGPDGCQPPLDRSPAEVGQELGG